ncbi:MAG TPA: Uma2 family endonuclease [Bryobacteraceae bacterium]|nr:Uma2 family endonuclease [Bryobacteraceae bacterium]
MTPEQYLELEREAEFKSEYYQGHVYAMSGGSFPHGQIIGNLTLWLALALEKRPCSVIPNDLRVRAAPDGLYPYSDRVVVCGKPQFAGGHGDTLLNPALLIEVLSPSTEAYDRGFKSAQYRTIESLQEYALVSQTEPRVEIFTRQPGAHWLLSEAVGLESSCRFESVDCGAALAEIYDKITFAEEAAQGVES